MERRNKIIKEWAYAGFYFAMTGALISHLVIGDKWQGNLLTTFSDLF